MIATLSCAVVVGYFLSSGRLMRYFGLWLALVLGSNAEQYQVHRTPTGSLIATDIITVRYTFQVGPSHPTTGFYQYRILRSGSLGMQTATPITTDTTASAPRVSVNNGVITENPTYTVVSTPYSNAGNSDADANNWSGFRLTKVYRVFPGAETLIYEGSWGPTITWLTVIGGGGNAITLDYVVTLDGTPPVAKTLLCPWTWKSSSTTNHTLALFVNGSQAFSTTAKAGVEMIEIGSSGTASKTPIVGGETYEWKVDGVVMERGTVPFEFEGNTWTAPSYGIEVQGVPPQGTPTATPGNTGNTIPGGGATAGGGTPGGAGSSTGGSGTTDQAAGGGEGVLVNNFNRTISGTGAGATNQDIYNDVRMALNTAGNQDSGTAGLGAAVDPGDAPEYGETPDSASVQSAFSDKVSSGKDKLGAISPVSLPTSNGSKTSFNITLPMYGSKTMDLAPYSTPVSIFRGLLLFVLTISFYFITINIIRKGIA